MTDTHADETYARWDLDGDRTVKLATEPHRTVAVFAQPDDARRAVVAVNAQTAPTTAEQENGLDDLRGQQASPDVWMALIDARAEVQRQENRLRQAQARGLDVDLIGRLGQAAIDACESLPYDMRKRPEPTAVMVGRHLLENAATVDLRSVWVARAQHTVDALQADAQRLTGNLDALGQSLDVRREQAATAAADLAREQELRGDAERQKTRYASLLHDAGRAAGVPHGTPTDEIPAAVERLRVERDYWQQETDHRAAQTTAAFEQRDQLLDGDRELWELLVGNRNTPAARATLKRLRTTHSFPRQDPDGSTVIGPECFATYPLGDSKMPAAIRVTGERAICWQGEWFYAGEPIDPAPPALPDANPLRWPQDFSDGLTETIPGLVNSYGALGVKRAVDSFAQADAEAAAADTTSDTSRVVVGGRYVVGENPTVIDMDSGARMPATVAQEGEAMVVLAIDSRGNARGRGWRDDGPTWPMLDPRHLTPAPVEADTTPDTSRVTFGARHEGTGMVLLQHADIPREWWGFQALESAKHHRRCVVDPGVFPEFRAAHAALAEVREALDAAERETVNVWANGRVSSEGRIAAPDVPQGAPLARAHAQLAREVQALVDQGLRGDDLNARVPYEVRDHRAPVEAVEFSNDGDLDPDEVGAADRIAVERMAVADVLDEHQDLAWIVQARLAIEALDAHRAARTSEPRDADELADERYDAKMTGANGDEEDL